MFAASHPVAGGGSATIYGAVLGQDVGTRSTAILVDAAQKASQALVDAELAAVAPRTILPAGTAVLRVTNAQGLGTTAVTDTALTMLALPGTKVSLTVTDDRLGTAVRAGQQVATVSAPGLRTGVHTVAATKGVTLRYKLEHIF